MNSVVETIRTRLFEMRDDEYRTFLSRLIPTVEEERILGVRVPFLRAYAKELKGTSLGTAFLASLPHFYYEENNLHAFLIETIRDWDACTEALNAFLPQVDNWATCDMMSPKALKKDLDRTLEAAKCWIASEHVYTVRFALNTLMRFYLDDAFDPSLLELAAALRSEEYYVRVMVAWYFATALAKQWEAALPFIAQFRLDVWTHNKAIQKAVESNRISREHKTILKKYRISAR